MFSNLLVQVVYLLSSRIADLTFRQRESANGTATHEAKFLLEEINASCGDTVLDFVADSDLFSGSDRAVGVDGFAFQVTVPAILSIGQTAVVDEAYCGIDCSKSVIARQCVGFDDAAKGVLAREIVV